MLRFYHKKFFYDVLRWISSRQNIRKPLNDIDIISFSGVAKGKRISKRLNGVQKKKCLLVQDYLMNSVHIQSRMHTCLELLYLITIYTSHTLIV